MRVTMKTVQNVYLEMDMATAQALHAVCRHIGGPSDGPRGKIDKLAIALSSAGIGSAGIIGTVNGGGLHLIGEAV